MMQRDLPDYDNPPIIETALGVEFDPLALWEIPHFGLFWHEIKDDYPKSSVMPPLPSQRERFGAKTRQPSQVEVELLLRPEVRCWFSNESQTELIQVQNDRLVLNWRKVTDNNVYPHYENTRPKFEREWGRFCEFVTSQKIGLPDVKQCEVTYVNHIEQGEGWETLADLAGILPCWVGASSEGFLPTPEAIALNAKYLMPQDQGRLYIKLQTAIRHTDAKEILQLTLTARGQPASSDTTSILQWLDLGHEWVVRGFTDFTSAKMHDLWKRRRV